MRAALQNIVRRFVGPSRCENQPQLHADLQRWTSLVDRMPDEFIDLLAHGHGAADAAPPAQNDAVHDVSDGPRSAG
jgi:hypothetical protein